MKAILTLVRWKNLLIIALTFLLLRDLASPSPLLSWSAYLGLILGTIFIAAAGNIINDILDYDIDIINKPQRVIIHKIIPTTTAYFYYVFLNIAALLFAYFLVQKVVVYYFFVMTIFLLFFYSLYFKKKPLIGNLIIATLCTWIVVEFWWVEGQNISPKWHTILGYYCIFAFLATWVRELIKDLEDMEGDRLHHCNTLPIWLGENKSLILAKTLVILLFISLLKEAFFCYQQRLFFALGYVLVFLLPPLLFLLKKLQINPNYSNLSQWLKYYMLLGLVLLFLF